MSAKKKDAPDKLTKAFGESYGAAMKTAVDAQQRNIQLAQGWVENVSGLMESQTEANKALTRAMESYVKVVDEALKSQDRTNRALAESMESYKEVVDKVSALQEKNTENFFTGITGELKRGTENSEALAQSLMQGSEKQMAAFQSMLTEAMDSYTNLMSAPFALYQKNLEAFGKQGK
jgi:hypothetical protein